MLWLRQKAAVDRLSALADERKQRLAAIRRAMHDWKFATFGNLRSVAWAFAAGAVVAANQRPSKEDGGKRSMVMKAANASLLTWRLFGRPGLDGAAAGGAQGADASALAAE